MSIFKIVYLTLICLSIALSIYCAIYNTICLIEKRKAKQIVKVKNHRLKRVREVITLSYKILFYDANGKLINSITVGSKGEIKKALKNASNNVAKYKVECIENRSLK